MLKWTKQQQNLQLFQTLSHTHTRNSSSPSTNSKTGLKTHTRKRYSCDPYQKIPTQKSKQKMPTMTHTLERRLHRRSLDNQLDTAFEERRRSRHSLTGNHNKENFGVHFMRNSFGNTSLTALTDLSNGKSPRRSMEATPPAVALQIKRINTPGQDNETRERFSDDFAAEDDVTPLSRLRFRNKIKEDSLSSSRMGDVTLDRMLDAIIESARKEVKPKSKLGQLKKQKDNREQQKKVEEKHENEVTEDSIHEMEVKTPQHLKRQRVVRRKNPKHFTEKKVKKEKIKERDIKRETEMIGLTLPNGIPSPETPLFRNSMAQKALLSMPTPPQHLTFEVENDLQRCSTPTGVPEQVLSIKRCLSFSCNSEEDEDNEFAHNDKRSSVASSIASSTQEQLNSSSSALSTNTVKGSLDVAIYKEKDSLNVHVIRCRDLQRTNGSTSLNAYVKVALIRKAETCNQGFQRTAVHRQSSRPYFDHCFKFDLKDLNDALDDLSDDDRLQMAVWHRDRQLKRSEFLGCISFPLNTLLQQQEINGSYKLQAQQCLNKPQPLQPVQQHFTQLQQQQHQQHQHHPQQFSPASVTPQNHIIQQQQPQSSITSKPSLQSLAALNNPNMATTLTQMRNTDDAVSIDSMATGQMMGEQQPMILSKKALHQRDADENLFLRFLELDPPATDVPTQQPNQQGTPLAGGGARRLSNTKPLGRTPFTMTKKLTRTAERGFGFSIVWTHPPRVEKVEPGLSADRCGILPGDYVIFVDKHNVVTMPEADVLNLIRSQGATLTLEIFRRSGSGTSAGNAGSSSINTATSVTHRSLATTLPMNGKTSRMAASGTSINNTNEEIMSVTIQTNSKQQQQQQQQQLQQQQHMLASHNRPSTACSVNTTSSLEAAKRRLNLPQVTFSKESIAPITDNRRRFLLQLISREQNFMSAIHFGMQRFVQPLQERKDLITPNDHRTLFQNIDELLRISEDVLEQLCHDDQEPQMNFASRVYLSKTTAICAAYKKYCNGIKRADCVLVNKSRQTGSEFVNFITEPPVPRKRPDLTMFIHRPLQHFREILKLMQLLASNCHVDSEEHKNFTSVINELQAAYREITVTSGLMEPLGEGRPLLTLQDLESRMVFTKCKPFTLAVQGRQWIFGGDLSRVEGRSVKPYWTLLFSDIIVFAKVSRDRVLFITEEPIPIANIVDSCFHMRKKTTEFRLTVDPNGRLAESPTGYCAPDLTKTPKKGARRKSLVLRAPSLELKAVWQNLLQRQIFLVNAALGSTPLSSPLDSPDVLNTLVPLSDIGIASASIGSIKLSSMDSINMKNQQHHHQQNNRLSSNVSEQIEKLIDEKCRILNKTGTPKSSALHLANWMKGQLDKQQEQARLAVVRSLSCDPTTPSPAPVEDDPALCQESDHDERITYWTRQQLEKRTKELNLAKENGLFSVKSNFGGKRLSGVDVMSMSDVSFSEGVSQISQSHSTTSDSQITVRSSPIVLDKLAVCRHCHKNCQQQQQHQQNNASPTTSSHQDHQHHHQHHQHHAYHDQKQTDTVDSSVKGPPPLSPSSQMRNASGLICHSLKVQHSQSSPQRCSKVNGSTGSNAAGTNSRASSVTSISSGTVTGDKPFAVALASGSKCEVGDTESDVAQLLSDDIYQSEATDEGVAGGNSSTATTTAATSSTSISSSGVEEARRRITDSIYKLRILDEHNEANILMNGHHKTSQETLTTTESTTATSSATESEEKDQFKPEPPPRKFVQIQPQTAKEVEEVDLINEKVKTSITLTETAQIVKVEEVITTIKTTQTPISPKSPKSPKSPRSAAGSCSPQNKQFVPCTCKCLPEDFANTTLSPEEVELKTCKLLESPKQSPKLPRSLDQQGKHLMKTEDPHRYCKCTCDKTLQENLNNKQQTKEDDDLSLMLIGLAQLTPAAKLLNMKTPTAPMPTPTQNFVSYAENGFVPTISIVPATPDSVLTKTSTHVWDNSSSTATANLLMQQGPIQAVIENIPEDSCDESPLDEEPPYRPMSSSLRRFGTMSSLEKLPSEERLEDNLEEYDDDDEDVEDNDDEVDDDDEELMDKARADNIELDNEIRVVTKVIYDHSQDSQGSSLNALNGSAWTTRASTFVSGKMSFFEESRAFIDKYLGRWNQDQANVSTTGITSDPEEQMDECTSGATSGEEVWGTPTSGGDNDDMHLANSENTQSSPTKSSNSLNDDDDTELMMDELLMAPPMSASTIRGLLPRRRLEPLFEEETESDEEKTQQESEELKKGETTTNGHYLEDSVAGSSSEEQEEEGEEEEEEQVNTADYDEEDEEDQTSTEERLPTNLPTTTSGPRPLKQPVLLPTAVLKASSCEYLLDQPKITTPPVLTAKTSPNSCSKTTTSATICSTMDSTVCTPTQTTTTRVLCTASTITSSVNDTIVKDKDVGSSSSSNNNNIQQAVEPQQAKPVDQLLNKEVLPKTAVKTLPRPAKFIPPPPPPRRLLLTQTNLKTSTATPKSLEKVTPPQKSGAFADDGFSVPAATDVTDVCNAKMPQSTSALPCLTTTMTTITNTSTATTTMTMTTMTKIPQPLEDVYSIRRYSAPANSSKSPIINDCYSAKPRPSSTIIETSLLGSTAQIDNSSNINLRYKSSTIVSTMKEKDQQQQHLEQQQENNKEKEQRRILTNRKDQTEQTHVTGKDSKSACAPPGGAGSGLSPRLEMRLALNHDIMGDEDLISYDPGPDLTTILGHDLSTFQRRTGRDLLNRSAMNRVQPKEAVISFSQQRNSKMDTPTVNRRPRPTPQLLNNNSTSGNSSSNSNYNIAANPTTVSSMPFVGSARVAGVPQHLQPNRNTWSSSVSVAHNRDENVSVVSNSKNISYNSGDNKLSDLEILARREKIYCMSQLRSGSQVKTMMTTTTTTSTMTMKSNNFYNNNPLTRTTSTTSMGAVTDEMHMMHTPKKGQRQRKIGRDETALMEAGKANKLINFIKRRNSENPSTANNSQTSLNDSNASSTPQHKQIPMSPRKDNDKPSLNRRLWKQITKRRRSNSVSELVAS